MRLILWDLYYETYTITLITVRLWDFYYKTYTTISDLYYKSDTVV